MDRQAPLLWQWYMQLTQVEEAFKTLKSDLGVRPIHHRKMWSRGRKGGEAVAYRYGLFFSGGPSIRSQPCVTRPVESKTK